MTKTSNRFDAFDIVVVPFPYADRLAEKRRPALVVSSPELERNHGFVWVAMITSAKGGQRKDDVALANAPRTGLSAASVVRPTKLATVEPARVIRVAGAISPTELKRVLSAVRAWL